MKVSLDCILHILFERSGARMVTGSQTIYWMNTTGLSAAYQRLLTAVVDGLCAMDLRAQGKPIHVRLKGRLLEKALCLGRSHVHFLREAVGSP